MSKYTTELRYVIESGYNLQLNEYPIFNESYRNVLNKKIIEHYKFREIGFETASIFRDRLKERLNLIMPYYNMLYDSLYLAINPFATHGTTETYEKNGNGNNHQSTIGESNTVVENNDNQLGVYSDTPQEEITVGNLEDNLYATTASVSKSDSNQKSDSTINNTTENQFTTTEDFLKSVTGFAGVSQSELLLKYRETFINIDMEVLKQLKDLFMNIW